MKPFVMIAFGLFCSAAAAAGELPDAVVEKILGISGVQHQPSKYSKTDTNYLDAAGQMLFGLRIAEPTLYDVWKQVGADKIEKVPGVGDEAFTYKKVGALCAKSAKSAVCVSPAPRHGHPVMTQIQAADLVKAAF